MRCVILVDKPTPDVKAFYEFGTILGRGSTSIVRKVKHKETEVEYACKSISKGKLTRPQDIEDMKKEIEVNDYF